MSTPRTSSAYNVVAPTGQVRRPSQTDDRSSASHSKKMVNPYAKRKGK